MAANLYIGTCSWKYDSWRGLIYPENGELNYLRHYAQHYDTVEIDQWFWSLFEPDHVVLPRADVVDDYAASVPESFRFTIKVPNSVTLTHFYRKQKNDPLKENAHFLSVDVFNRFLDSIHPLLDQTFSFMLQFEYLNKQKMESQNQFQDRLAEFVEPFARDIPLGIEIRNPNYLNKSFFEFLNSVDVHYVFLQGYYMPDITEVFGSFAGLFNDRCVIRLHGPDRKGIEQKSSKVWNRIYDSKDQELDRIADMVLELENRQVDVALNVNNHYEGSSPLTTQRFQDLYENKKHS
jgi:uncharacterized protein YecE (DUF72 family)